MNTDIRLDVGWPGHRKTRRILRALGPGGPFHLVQLWIRAALEAPSGDLSSWTAEDIAAAAGWPEGDAERFVHELAEAGWIDREDGRVLLHDWADHQPWAANAEERREAARKAGRASGKSRAKKEIERNGNGAFNSVRNPFEPPIPNPNPNQDQTPGEEPANKPPDTRLEDRDLEWALALRASRYKDTLSPVEYHALLTARENVGDPKLFRIAWRGYLEDESSFVAGHYPRKFAREPLRWAPAAGSSRRGTVSTASSGTYTPKTKAEAEEYARRLEKARLRESERLEAERREREGEQHGTA